MKVLFYYFALSCLSGHWEKASEESEPRLTVRPADLDPNEGGIRQSRATPFHLQPSVSRSASGSGRTESEAGQPDATDR